MKKTGTFIKETETLTVNVHSTPKTVSRTNCKGCVHGEVITESKTIREGCSVFNIAAGNTICHHNGDKTLDMYNGVTVCSAFRSAKEEVRKAFEEGR